MQEMEKGPEGAKAEHQDQETTNKKPTPRRRPSGYDPVYHFNYRDLPLDSGDFTYFPDPNLHEENWYDVIAWWSEFTSIHGVYYAFERGHFNVWKRRLWLLFTLSCFGSLIGTLIVMIQEFQQFSLNTSIQKINPTFLSFPQVTLCNTNTLDASRQNSTGITDPVNEAELVAVSQPLDEFILDSSFNRQILNLQEAWKPIITAYGLCYTFQTDRHVFRPGSDGGLEVYAWLAQENYQSTTLEAGVRVFVTQTNTELISDQTAQTFVGPGTAAFIQLQLTEFKREEEHPWSRCSNDIVSNEQCRTRCEYNVIREYCGCRLIGDPNNTVTNYCNATEVLLLIYDYNNNTDRQEEDDGLCTWAQASEFLASCNCDNPPCRENQYTAAYSSAALAKRLSKGLEDLYELPTNSFSDNFVSITINFGTLQYDLFEENKDKTFSGLVSDLGGQLGLFMGFSIISVAELVVELIGLRLIPRWFGHIQLYGIGQKQD